MNKIAIVSQGVPQICSKLSEMGYKLIYTESVDEFISYEKFHADMQCLVVNDTMFILKECQKLSKALSEIGINTRYTYRNIYGTYPKNILLNAQIIGKHIIGRIDSLDDNLKEYCTAQGFTFINVNQGYSGCSCLKVDDNSLITADPSIYKALKNTNLDVLKIGEGHIKLHGTGDNTFGFIGGASVTLDDKTILFFGDIRKHPDYLAIKQFCDNKDINIDFISDIGLTDIGSAVLLNF